MQKRNKPILPCSSKQGIFEGVELVMMRNRYLRNIKLIYLLNFFTDFILFAPVAIIYFEKVTGSYALGMSIFSVAYVSAALFEIPTGVVSDMVGRKLTTIFGAFSSLLCLIIYAISGSYWQLVVGALFQGLSRAFYSGNNDALLYDSLKKVGKEKSYHVFLGKTSSMFQVALAIASVMGGLLANISFSLVMWFSVLPQIGAVLTSLLLTDPGVNPKGEGNIYSHLRQSFSQFFQNTKLRMLTFASMIKFSLGESGFFLNSAFINSIWPLWAVGISYTLAFIGGAASYWFSGALVSKYGPYKVFNASILYSRFVGITGLLLRNVYSPLIMNTSSLTFGLGSVSESSLIQKEFTDLERATMGSIKSFLGNIAFGIVSFLVGVMADRIGIVPSLLVVQLLQFLPVIIYMRIYRG